MGDQIHCQDEAHYRQLKAKIAVYDEEVRRKNPPDKSGCRSYDPKTIVSPAVTNEERSAVQTWEFQHSEDDRYCAYVNLTNRFVTTWTGQIIGRITYVGRKWSSVFGDHRIPISVVGINSVVYHGTFFSSSGDYCRLKAKRHKGSIVKKMV